MNKVLDAENQQLVVLNGDLITGENSYKSNASVYVDQIVAPIVNRGRGSPIQLSSTRMY